MKTTNAKVETRFVIRSEESGRYIKAVGETGFKHTNWMHATQFLSEEQARAFMADHGIRWEVLIQPLYLTPALGCKVQPCPHTRKHETMHEGQHLIQCEHCNEILN